MGISRPGRRVDWETHAGAHADRQRAMREQAERDQQAKQASGARRRWWWPFGRRKM